MVNLKYYNDYINSIDTDNITRQPCQWHHILPRCCGGSDDPSNLIHLTYEEHLEAHRLLFLAYQGEEVSSKLGYAYHKMALACSTSEEYESHRKTLSSMLIELWKDPEYRNKMLTIASSKERNDKLSNSLKDYYKDPKNRKRHSELTSEGLLEYYKDPENREKHRLAVIESNNRPEVRKRISEATKEALKRPEVVKKMSESRSGTTWYNDGVRNYRTKDPVKIEYYISQGYKLGKIRVNKE